MDPITIPSSDGTVDKSVRDSSENEDQITENSSETETETEEEDEGSYSWEGGSEEEETDDESPENITVDEGSEDSLVDRISTLPDSVVRRILSFLPSTQEAVQSGILSNRWRNQWARVPVLIFSPTGNKYFRFIENTLILHNCSNLKKFQLEYDPESRQDPQFFAKIRFALQKEVEELILLCYCDREPYLLPKFLFDNASLIRLEMDNCYFMPNWRVNWESLKSLKMDCSSMSSDGKWIENVVSGSPSLESLELSSGTLGDQVAIVSKSLKILILEDIRISSDTKFSCPNLVVLHVVTIDWSNSTFTDQMVRDVLSRSLFLKSFKLVTYNGYDQLVIASNSLKILHLDLIQTKSVELSCPNLEKLDLIGLESEKFEVVNLPSSVCATLYFTWCRESLTKQIIEQLHHVEEIIFHGSFTTIVADIEVDWYITLPLLKCKSLTLNVGSSFAVDLPAIAYALRSPNLETLVINFKSPEFTTCKILRDLIKSRENYWKTNEPALFGCLASHLKIVKIIGLSERYDEGERKLVANFVEFLLKNASVLDKMIAI